jgi:DNA polymerase-3 subunit delta
MRSPSDTWIIRVFPVERYWRIINGLKTVPEKLDSVLTRGLAPVYLISGEEPLTAGEAADLIRAKARAQGFTEREVYFAERANSGPWDDIFSAAQSLSLFSARRILDVGWPGGTPGAAGEKVLRELAGLAGPELLVLVITGELDWQTQKAAWVQALEQAGVWVQATAVPPARMPDWIRARAAREGITLDAQAVDALAAQTEGNLLAAIQEIRKLALGGLSQAGAADVLASVSRSGRYDVTQLGEAMLNQDRARALRILAALRAEGEEPTLLLWSLVQELRALWLQLVPGAQVQGIWSRNRRAIESATPIFRQRGRAAFARLTARAARIDRINKGRAAGNAWDELALLVVDFTTGENLLAIANTAA